jgi:TrmH family RNA methyltransferase
MRVKRTELTSSQNPLLQRIRRANETGRPTDEGWIMAEGPNLLSEVRRSACMLEMVLVTAEAEERHRALLHGLSTEIVLVSERALASVAGTQNTQGILSAIRFPAWSWPDLVREPAAVVVLDGVQDPGNAGAIARSAEAFGATGIVFLEGSARVSNGKFLRASAGSIFRIPFVEGLSSDELVPQLKNSHITCYALSPRQSVLFTDACFSSPFALVTGAEGAGISTRIASQAQMISIPTAHVESLNTAVACSLVLFEASRQRRPA